MREGLDLAVGDIIAFQSTAAGGIVYQPAVGVEVIITAVFQYNGGAQSQGLRNAAGDESYLATAPAEAGGGQMNCKIGVTNTVYWKMTGSAYKPGFTGIQTK
jgi:hypothetical protein